jgi:branched-chain amino acid aminotransferase
MINYNGNLQPYTTVALTSDNRAFKYGDGVFETLKIVNSKIIFFEEHYFRLMASMRMIRMEIPMDFTQENLEKEIIKTANAQGLIDSSRVRLTVFRKDGGKYFPLTNEIDYVIEVAELIVKPKSEYIVDLFKDHYVHSGILSTIKSTNRILNVVSSIYATENELDSCILLNEKKQIVEVIHGNIFLVKGTEIITPSITEGCIKGVIRNKLIQILKKNPTYSTVEREISPFELQKADELFITNSIIDIQSVTNYRKKIYKTEIGEEMRALLKKEYV